MRVQNSAVLLKTNHALYVSFYQTPFNTIYYEVVPLGDDYAHLYFRVHEQTGEVRVAQDLTADEHTDYMVSW